MANKLISQMGLPKSMANVLAARNIVTAKDALSLTEYELMELSDVGLAEIISAVFHISEIACPPHQTALALLEQRKKNEFLAGHLPTHLKGVDVALCGGLPFGVVTELVGPAGVGKTQFCLKLSLLACLPSSYGGLDGCVIYIDTESKFSSRRMIEIGMNSFPEIFQMEGMVQQMAGRILVLQPASLAEFTDSLQKVKISLLQCKVKLLIIDSMAAVVSGSLAEFSRIPVMVTNQVRSHSGNDRLQYNFEAQNVRENQECPVTYDSHLVAALGVSWAHAVSIRLVLETRSGQRFIKIAKSSLSPALAFPFTINASGISLLDDEGSEISGPEANMIYREGKLYMLIFFPMIGQVHNCTRLGAIRSLAEFSRIPVMVTNQVRSRSGNDRLQYNFEAQNVRENQECPVTYDSHLVAALEVSWPHAVSIRLVLETRSGQRFIKIAKSSVSPALAFPFTINASGISLLDDEVSEISGPEANMIYREGQGGPAISDTYSFE